MNGGLTAINGIHFGFRMSDVGFRISRKGLFGVPRLALGISRKAAKTQRFAKGSFTQSTQV